MNRRWICGILAALLLLGILPSGLMKAKADSQMRVSDALVDILKEYEGFSGACVKDNSQRSVGYGTRCDVCDPNASSYPNKQTCSYTAETPITEEKATQLFRNFLTDFEQRVNNFCNKYNLIPSETLFIDDSKKNIDGAIAYGINGYLFDGDVKKLKEYLETLV